ncbi:MAG: RDD family protein [Bdellovibrionota bacterium]
MQTPSPSLYAGFWIRSAAYLIDSLIIMIPEALLGRASLIIGGPEAGPGLSVLMNLLFGFFYFAILQAQLEGTPGKRILGLRLLGENFSKMTLTQAASRYVMWIVGAFCAGIGLMQVGWDPRKQGWHDKLAKTLVVHQTALSQALPGTPRQLDYPLAS